jgi:hypothetical protein
MAKTVKEIKITANEDGLKLEVKGLNAMEVLGLLRLYEQKQSLFIIQQFNKETIK